MQPYSVEDVTVLVWQEAYCRAIFDGQPAAAQCSGDHAVSCFLL